jgi:hypothetical protein
MMGSMRVAEKLDWKELNNYSRAPVFTDSVSAVYRGQKKK